jgi:hypothetical protein
MEATLDAKEQQIIRMLKLRHAEGQHLPTKAHPAVNHEENIEGSFFRGLRPDSQQKQLDQLRRCSGRDDSKSTHSLTKMSKLPKSEQHPLEDLLEPKTHPNYNQFIQGLPKVAGSEYKSDASTMLTSDEKTESVSIQLTNGTNLSSVVDDETFMTNISLGKEANRKKKTKLRSKHRTKKRKRELYREWTVFDHKLRPIATY